MKTLRALLLAPTALLLAGAAPAPAAEWTDLFLGYRYCYHVNDPTIDHDIIKNVVQFTANRYSLGSNFLNVDVLMSNGYDPANGAGSAARRRSTSPTATSSA
jgi:hypothetical protein